MNAISLPIRAALPSWRYSVVILLWLLFVGWNVWEVSTSANIYFLRGYAFALPTLSLSFWA